MIFLNIHRLLIADDAMITLGNPNEHRVIGEEYAEGQKLGELLCRSLPEDTFNGLYDYVFAENYEIQKDEEK